MAHHTRLFALIALVLPATVAAAGRHVHLPFIRKGKGPGPRISKRDASAVTFKDNLSPYAFVAEVAVGTPPQKMELVITTSTGQTWVQNSDASYCVSYKDWVYPVDEFGYRDYSKDPEEVETLGLCTLGSFNKTLSSTYQNANQQYEDFSVDLPGGDSPYGQNFTDHLALGDIKLTDVPMGLVKNSATYVGFLGLGYNSTSRSSYYDSYSSYDSQYQPSFMDRMVRDDHITTRAFSMWLDDAEGKSGNLLFGAVDHSRYEGELVRVKAISQYAYPGTFGVTLDGLSLSSKADSKMESFPSNDFPLGVTFGPGDVLSYLPPRLYSKIAEAAGAEYNISTRLTTIPCDAAKTNKAKFSIRLSGPEGPVVNFEMADLVISKNLTPSSYDSYYGDDGSCIFGVQERDNSDSSSSSSYGTSTYILGSSVLRRTFMTFDLQNREVAVAPVKFVSGSDKASPTIVAFESSGAPVPSATLYCGDTACIDYCSYYTCNGPVSTSTSNPGAPGGGSGYPGSSGSSPGSYDGTYWKTVAIALGVTFGLLVLVGLIALAILFRRAIKGDPSKDKDVEEDGSESPGPGPEMAGAGPAGTRMEAPGTLPVIREGQEDADSGAPQLPVLANNLGDPMTPPEPLTPLTPSTHDARAVSPVSADDVPASQTSQAAAPVAEGDATKLSKGKGVEVDDRQI